MLISHSIQNLLKQLTIICFCTENPSWKKSSFSCININIHSDRKGHVPWNELVTRVRFLHSGSPCPTWPAPRSTSCWGNLASTKRLNQRTRCRRSFASLLPKTARLKMSRRTNPPLPLLPQRTPPQNQMQKSSTLTYNPSRVEKIGMSKYHYAPKLLWDQLVIAVDDKNSCHFYNKASRSWISPWADTKS